MNKNIYEDMCKKDSVVPEMVGLIIYASTPIWLLVAYVYVWIWC